jgi:hypothetical protein
MWRARRARAAARARRGRAAAGLPLGVALSVAGALLFFTVRGVEARAARGDMGWVDPAALELGAFPEWADPRWSEELDRALAECEPFTRWDEAGLARVVERLQELSFVREVSNARVTGDPARLELDLHICKPVACLPTPEGFYLVAGDGTLLAGLWPVPPLMEQRYLPVIGPMRDAHGLFALARVGDWLTEQEHLDALDVALSLAEHLPSAAQARLGRLVIDASRARQASEDVPGVVLELDGGRLVLFGRPPSMVAPGELSVARKWDSFARALMLLADPADPGDPAAAATDDGVQDWDLVDVRWDRPEIRLRGAPRASERSAPKVLPKVAGSGGASRRDAGASAQRPAPDRTGPTVH